MTTHALQSVTLSPSLFGHHGVLRFGFFGFFFGEDGAGADLSGETARGASVLAAPAGATPAAAGVPTAAAGAGKTEASSFLTSSMSILSAATGTSSGSSSLSSGGISSLAQAHATRKMSALHASQRMWVYSDPAARTAVSHSFCQTLRKTHQMLTVARWRDYHPPQTSTRWVHRPSTPQP